jgi:hypothetical protein
MKDKFDEFACAYKNEETCMEELEEEGLDIEEVEKQHFEDDE